MTEFDIRALAKAINRRRQELMERRPQRMITITPAMSRILDNDEDYVPYRKRKPQRARKRGPTNPAIGTLVEIAALLDTTVGHLLGERPYRITKMDRERVGQIVRYLSQLFDLDERDT